VLAEVTDAQIDAVRTNGQTVTYIEGETEVELKALLGRSKFDSADVDGRAHTEWSDQDFLVVAADLHDAGVSIEPRRGVRIRLTQAGRTFTYEILPFGDERHWRYSGPTHAVLRLHGKLVLTE